MQNWITLMDRWQFVLRVWAKWDNMVHPVRIENGVEKLTETGAVAIPKWQHRVRRFVNTFTATRAQQRSLRHVETLSLGAKQKIHLLECEGQRFLVADGLSAPVPLLQRFAVEEE